MSRVTASLSTFGFDNRLRNVVAFIYEVETATKVHPLVIEGVVVGFNKRNAFSTESVYLHQDGLSIGTVNNHGVRYREGNRDKVQAVISNILRSIENNLELV